MLMIKFEMRGVTVKELPDGLAQAAMRVLKREDCKFSKVGNVVFIKNKEALRIVLRF